MCEKDPKVSVIIVNFRGLERLEKCLKSLERTKYPNFDIIVVDCLTDNIETWLRERFPNVKLIHYDYDIGASASHNVDRRFLDPKTKYLAFLDNDVYVTENWLTELVKVLESNKEIGVAQAKILIARKPSLLDHAGLAIDALGTWHTSYGSKAGLLENVLELFAASSAGCIVRRDVFEEVGGFDPDYYIYDDDTDFSFRVRLLGYKVVLVPSAIVLHDSEPTRFLKPKKLYHSVKNRICTMLKNYEIKNLWWRLIAYIISALLAGFGLALMGKVEESKEIIRGLIYPLTNARKIWMKRALIQSRRKIRDSGLIRKGLLRRDPLPTIFDIKSKLSYLRG
ncbi:glycosyltransferase family 2 protein [Candidatus Bathyarchaeota archaeon]|nr:glycosyltransferase family 2 protein [Candidatus Bathyarchaeota archaeon]